MSKWKYTGDFLKYLISGLLALVLLLFPNLISSQRLDLYQLIALYCFCVAIPFLGFCLMIIFYGTHKMPEFNHEAKKKIDKYIPFMVTCALLPTGIGIFFLLLRVSRLAAILFFLSVCICEFIHQRCIKDK